MSGRVIHKHTAAHAARLAQFLPAYDGRILLGRPDFETRAAFTSECQTTRPTTIESHNNNSAPILGMFANKASEVNKGRTPLWGESVFDASHSAEEGIYQHFRFRSRIKLKFLAPLTGPFDLGDF